MKTMLNDKPENKIQTIKKSSNHVGWKKKWEYWEREREREREREKKSKSTQAHITSSITVNLVGPINDQRQYNQADTKKKKKIKNLKISSGKKKDDMSNKKNGLQLIISSSH